LIKPANNNFDFKEPLGSNILRLFLLPILAKHYAAKKRLVQIRGIFMAAA
jgi:hypothetical protein